MEGRFSFWNEEKHAGTLALLRVTTKVRKDIEKLMITKVSSDWLVAPSPSRSLGVG